MMPRPNLDIALKSKVAAQNLTQWELLAVNRPLNMSDGHARQPLTPGQAAIVKDLPALFAEGEGRPVEEIEREAHLAYFRLLGQVSYPAGRGRVLSCYSSSVAMEILSRALAERMNTVALIHPTFDNIADLLRGCGLRLMPVQEDALHGMDLPRQLLAKVGCVFVTTPNNPTGRVLEQERLRRLAAQCAEAGVVLALDTSFRGFDLRAQYDHYAVLEASGCRWVVIEDTGKLWPTLDLKVGLLVTGSHSDLPLYKIYSDVLLGVSPLVLALVREFAEDAANGGLTDLHAFIAANRLMVRTQLWDLPGISFPDQDSRVSVERVDVGKLSATQVWDALRERSVYALPCKSFHWAQPADGEHLLRLALSRSPGRLATAARILRSALTELC